MIGGWLSNFARASDGGQPPLWGDGFEHDDLSDVASARSWNDISQDEYIRLFPRLVGTRPKEMNAYLMRGWAELSRRAEPDLYGPPATRGSAGLALLRNKREGRRPRSARVYDESVSREQITMIGKLLSALQTGSIPPYDSTQAEEVAFHSAVHPAYFWPEALLNHQLLTTLGWLGIVMRGRSALMPFDVAEYLIETIQLRSPRDVDVHPSLEKKIKSASVALFLRRKASIRLKGGKVIAKANALDRCHASRDMRLVS